jgi:hypothetical protein
MNSIADVVVPVAVSLGARVGVGAEKAVLIARAKAPVSRTAARRVKRISNIVAMSPQQNEVNAVGSNYRIRNGTLRKASCESLN